MKPKTRAVSYLTTAQFDRLNHACLLIAEAFPMHTYLVGSCMETADFRDVDVRTILPDDEFDAIFSGREFFWSVFCHGVSHYLSDVSGLPVDYQVQRMTEANEKYDGMRNPIGKRSRPFAGGGDATPFGPPFDA